ncbi:MAG: hypothetical protein AABX97_06710 [Candidatus Thermoplasmatota archaeon]
MGMGLLRWFLRPRRSDDEEEEPRKGAGKRGRHADPGVYRIEVDGEAGHLRGEGPPFSFWGSSRIILILAFLLWWIQPAGPIIAGYVGGRRAGSPMKAVVAALLPVVVIFAANGVYAQNVAAQQIDFVASLPNVVGDGAASILPFLAPYKEFLVAYMKGFVNALQSTFGMGTNGYLMVIIFSYIGGLIAEQTRRELYYRQGATQTVGLNLVQPILGGRHHAEAYEEEDEELQEMRRPTRARAHARGASAPGHRSRRRHGTPAQFDEYHKVSGETVEGHSTRRVSHARARDEDEEDAEAVPVRHAAHERHEERRHHPREARAADAEDSEEEDPEAVARREAREKEARRPRMRTHEEEVALQRFVERALRNYDHSKL